MGRSPRTAAGILVGLILGASLTAANAGGTTIRSCVTKSTGVLRLVERDCRASERVVTWNAQGEQGPAGPMGPRATLPAGTISGVHRIDGEYSSGNPVPGPGEELVSCPQGEVALSGSAQYKPGLNVPWIVLGTDMVSGQTQRLGNAMVILFMGYDWYPDGDALVQWTMLCGIVS